MIGVRIRCPSCGTEVDDVDQFCYRCGAELRPGVVIEAKPAPPSYAPPPPYAPVRPAPPVPLPGPPVPRLMEYAGFWLRFGASMIDGIILVLLDFGICLLLVSLPLVFGWGGYWFLTWASSWWVFGPLWPVSLLVGWVYFAGCESSSSQATPGKKALSLVVTNLNGERISFARATARYFCKFLSDLTLFIGYVMIGFTAKKQGLHDMIAGTLVFKQSV